jgi:GGDEF domain-containing protein
MARLAGAAALLAIAVSGSLLAAFEDRVYGVSGLLLSVFVAGLFVVMELRFARALGRVHALADPGELRGPAESVLGSLLDPETTLPRVWLFRARLTEEIQRAERYRRSLLMCVLEPEDASVRLDGEFRGKVGRAVRGHLRGSDFATVGRSGRLLMLLPETVGPAAEGAVKRLVATLNSLITEGTPLHWRGALVWYPEDGSDADQLLDSAQRLLTERPVS